MPWQVMIQTSPFVQEEVQKQLLSCAGDAGALVTFQGMVRGYDHEKPLSALFLEHFAGLTEREIVRIIHLARERWPIQGCTVIHRVGWLMINEPIVLVLVVSKHRSDAFAAAEFIMDYLKTEAPFWKKERFVDGEELWVAAKDADVHQKERWTIDA